ncbi:MAG: transcriptional repressor [Bacteroidales bacterium]|nr:transcriptional repressor [Bacteroidales bacterium]
MEKLLEEHGVKATANRLLVARELAAADRPLSLMELESRLETIDKSNIFRTLVVFKDAHLVHALEDSGDGVRYELCHAHGTEEDDDLHVHFHCTRCHRTFCLHDTPIPAVSVPEGYSVDSASYLLHGVCPECLAED